MTATDPRRIAWVRFAAHGHDRFLSTGDVTWSEGTHPIVRCGLGAHGVYTVVPDESFETSSVCRSMPRIDHGVVNFQGLDRVLRWVTADGTAQGTVGANSFASPPSLSSEPSTSRVSTTGSTAAT